MMRLFGYFSDKLSGDEKRFFLSTIEEYKRGRTLLSAPIGLLRSYIARFDEKYLKDQAFFAPYPRDLAEIHDSEKGREINSPQANFVKG